jgi:predicted nucleic acid-binding protein
LYKDALGIQAETGFSFYDSVIVASALAGNCRRLYSEDLQSGRTIRGMQIQNPFLS